MSGWNWMLFGWLGWLRLRGGDGEGFYDPPVCCTSCSSFVLCCNGREMLIFMVRVAENRLQQPFLLLDHPNRAAARSTPSRTHPASLTMHEGRLVDSTRFFMSRQERINNNCSVREMQIRIKNMRKWRRDLEDCVGWVREEFRRSVFGGGVGGRVG